MNRLFLTWLIAIFLAIGAQAWPELAQAAPAFQSDSCEALNEEGLTLSRQAQYSKALQQFQDALACYRESDDRIGEGTTLNNIGDIYSSLAQYQEALEYYQQALAINQELGNRAGEGITLFNIGVIYRSQGRYDKALDFYQQALEITREVGNRAGEGTIIGHIGSLYQSQGRYHDALEHLSQALEINREVGDRAGEGTIIGHIGSVYQSQGRYANALEHLSQALAITREVGNRAAEGTIIGHIGSVYQSQGRYEQALEFYQQALEITREVGNRAAEGIIIGHIGSVYQSQGRYEEALAYYQQALEITREVGNRAAEGTIIGQIGSVYQSQGRYEQALELYQQALAITREVGNLAEEGTIIGHIGSVYQSQGKYEHALESYQQALAITYEVGNRAGEGAILNHLGEVYNNQGRYEEALELFQQALEITYEVGNRAGEGAILNNIGLIYQAQGRYDDALEDFSQALEIAREVGTRADEGTTLDNIGEVYSNRGRYEEALNFFQNALSIQREVGDQVSEIGALYNIGIAYQQQNQSEQALLYYEQALDVLESVRAVAGSQAGRASFMLQYADLCSRTVELYHQQGKKTEAFFSSERCRARTFRDSLVTGQIQLSDDEVQVLVEQEREAYAQRRAIQDMLAHARALDPPDTAFVADLELQLENAEAAYTAVMVAIEARGDQLAMLVPGRSTVLGLSEIQAMLDEQTTLISYYVMGNEGTLAFIVTGDELTVVELPDATSNNLYNNAAILLQEWVNIENTHPKPLRDLHNWLVAPLTEHLKTPLVGIIPHQVLHYVPFVALTDGDTYFGEEYMLFTLPSASALLSIERNVDNLVPATEAAVIFANPDTGDSNFRSLPYAAIEAATVGKLLDAPVYIGTEAQEERLASIVSGAPVVHLAVNARYDRVDPLNSTIFLAPGGESDGRLELHEIYGLDLVATNFIILSGCQINLVSSAAEANKVISAGDEIAELTQAFFFAGTPTVISSLWAVDDAATEKLMGSFYRHWLGGMSKAEALQAAQAEVRKKYPSPFYWAPFVLSGDPGVAQPSRSPLPLLIGLGGGLLLVLVSGFATLTRSSGLPPTLLLRQKSGLIRVGLGYAGYHERWESGTPLDKLVVLLMPTSEYLTVKEIGQKLSEWRVPADVEQIQTALDTAVRDGLLLRQAGGYGLVEPHLARVLQENEEAKRREALARLIRHDHPLCANARRFFERANLNLIALNESLLYRCEPTSVELKRLLPAVVYARFLPGQVLDSDQVLAIRDQVKQVDSQASVVFAITDQRVDDDGWAQIGTLRIKSFTVLPIESALINKGLTDGRERKLLHTEIEDRLGAKYDPYDVRDPVAGAFSFFGRDALVEMLLRRIADGRPVGIFGLRKLGKSSLLHALRDRAEFPVAVVNLQTVGRGSLDGLYRRVLRYWAQAVRVRYELDWPPPHITSDEPTEAFVAATLDLFDLLAEHVQQEVRLGIFLDEVELVIPQKDGSGPSLTRYLRLFRALRGLVDEDGRLSLVVASLNPAINRINAWHGEQNPTFSLFQEINLSPLTSDACIQMVRNIGAQIGLVYSPESLQAISELSGGHPFLARQLCSLLYRERGHQSGRIEEREVWAIVQRFIYDDATAYHLDHGIWQEASNPTLWNADSVQVNQPLLLELAGADGPVPRDDLLKHPDADARLRALFNMAHFHIIYEPQPGFYAIGFGLLRLWLRQRKLK